MLKGKKLILAVNKFAKEDRKKSWMYTISTLMGFLFSMGLVIAVKVPVFQFLISILSGLLIVRMFVIYHDFLHKAIFKDSKIASWLFWMWGIYVLAPTTIWKRSHNYHHAHNSKLFKLSIGSFPVYSKKEFESCSKKEKFVYAFSRHPLAIVLGHYYIFLYGMCINPIVVNFKKHIDSMFSIVLYILVVIVSFVSLDIYTAFFVSIFPHFIAGGVGALLFYVQHNFPGVYLAEQGEWNYEIASLRSSSFFKMGRVMNWFTGNIGYHHIHHLNAKVPFYRLPEVMEEFDELRTVKKITVKDIPQCFRCKLWDTDKKEMVPF